MSAVSAVSVPDMSAVKQANRASEAQGLKTKIKEDVDLPDLSASDSSKMMNTDMEEILQRNMEELQRKRDSAEAASDVKIETLVMPRKRFLFFTVPASSLIRWSSVEPASTRPSLMPCRGRCDTRCRGYTRS